MIVNNFDHPQKPDKSLQTSNAPLLLAVMMMITATAMVSGCQTDSAAQEEPRVTYVCRETNQIFTGTLQPSPVINPVTGKSTLARGLYCEKCKKWRPAPDPAVFHRNPLSWPCPQHREAMSYDGPIPADAHQID